MDYAIEVSSEQSRSVRVQQVSAAFDVPLVDRQTLRFVGGLPIEHRDWRVGLIVGPSGSGKTTILRHVFGKPLALKWREKAVVDDFAVGLSIEEVTGACSAVGFNTIPAWLRPYKVLSTGEQFRVGLARAFLESPSDRPVVVDEFTSVVDRQVAKIGSHAAQKWARSHDRQLVLATCHHDVIDWLQPDWTLEPDTTTFAWRRLQLRPPLQCRIRRVPHERWQRYARFHYLTADLHRAARCFELFVDETPVAFAGCLHRPHPHASGHKIMGVSRVVTLPDWQGLGLAFALLDRLGAAYNAIGHEFHMYPAHPSLIRSFDRSPMWMLTQKPGQYTSKVRPDGRRATLGTWDRVWRAGVRPNAVFRYIGPKMETGPAVALLAPRSKDPRS